MIKKISKFLYLSLWLFFVTHARCAQASDTPVFCYPLGSVDCLGNVSVVPGVMTYSDCCTQPGAADVYYTSNNTIPSSSSQCTLCGPVFLEEESYPAFVSGTALIINWELHPKSIPVSRYRSRHYEVGASAAALQAIPSDFDPPASSLKFLFLTVGVNYVFSVVARGENGGLSELTLTWEAGKSHLPSFTDFNQTLQSSSSVTAEWVLNCSGVFPLEQMTIRWREGANESVDFPNENVVTFSYNNSSTLVDGALIEHQFQNLTPSTVYVVRIKGRNRLGNSSSHFVIETSDDIATFTLPVTERLASNADLTWKSPMRELSIPLLMTFIATLDVLRLSCLE